MVHTWDPDRYLTYADERGRPFVELVARIAATSPREVVDLGCGPGNLTGLLAERWPGAHLVGLDSSPEMIEKAQGLGQPVEYAVQWALPGRAGGTFDLFAHVVVKGVGSGAKNGVLT